MTFHSSQFLVPSSGPYWSSACYENVHISYTIHHARENNTTSDAMPCIHPSINNKRVRGAIDEKSREEKTPHRLAMKCKAMPNERQEEIPPGLSQPRPNQP